MITVSGEKVAVVVIKINNNLTTDVYKQNTFKRKFKNNIIKNWDGCDELYANTLIEELDKNEHYIDNEGVEYWLKYTFLE